MKKQIKGRPEIERLVNLFYEKVKVDSQLAPLFAHVHWEAHLPIMYQFWESTLLYAGTYSGNPMEVHQRLHERLPLSRAHFQRWKQLFLETVEQHFEGEIAERAKQRAVSIATVLEMKIIQ
jgi:hemoglobin